MNPLRYQTTYTMKELRHNFCYLASPYSFYPPGRERAFQDVCQIAGRLVREGVHTLFSPIAHHHPVAMYGGLDPLDHSIWLPLNETMLWAADILIVANMDGWRQSQGVTHETKTFAAREKPIYDLDVTEWAITRRPQLVP